MHLLSMHLLSASWILAHLLGPWEILKVTKILHLSLQSEGD